MQRETTSLRLSKAEYWYLRKCATEKNISMADMLRRLLHRHVKEKEGPEGLASLLQGRLLT